MLADRRTIKATLSAKRLNASLKKTKMSADMGSSYVNKDHSKLVNLDYLNSGHEGFAGIQFGTTAEWNAQRTYRPVSGMLIVYTDYHKEFNPETGETTLTPNFKIGNGNAYLGDIRFVGDDLRDLLQEHMEDTGLHIQPGEREFWNNKLNYEEPDGDLLEFTRN